MLPVTQYLKTLVNTAFIAVTLLCFQVLPFSILSVTHNFRKLFL
nr:MAG TPA: hypothetical protein [Caudoviricetes sp.]